jgi:pheromone shutdown protein TraB
MDVLSKEFPGLYRALVSDRDAFMAFRLRTLATRFERIVAVVGAGHETGIKRLFEGKS